MAVTINDSGITFNDGSVQPTALTTGTQTIAGAKTFSTSIEATVITEGGSPVPRMVLGTAQNTTSGTSIDFTSIPSWVKRITVLLNGVSTNGTSGLQVQIGAGSVTTTGYSSITGANIAASAGATTATSGFLVSPNISAATVSHGSLTISLMGSNTWVCQGTAFSRADTSNSISGLIALGGTLDRIRLTTVNGTDTFDAGSVNIMYEG